MQAPGPGYRCGAVPPDGAGAALFDAAGAAVPAEAGAAAACFLCRTRCFLVAGADLPASVDDPAVVACAAAFDVVGVAAGACAASASVPVTRMLPVVAAMVLSMGHVLRASDNAA